MARTSREASAADESQETLPLLKYDTFEPTRPLYSLDVRIDPAVEEKWIEDASPTKLRVADVQVMDWNHANTKGCSPRHRASVRKFSDFSDEGVDGEGLNILLDPYYDVTTGRMRRLFAFFTHDDNDLVTYDAFHHGLLALGIVCPEGADFDSFVSKVDTNQDQRISFPEFVQVVQMIKQAHLCKPEYRAQAAALPAVIRVVDYSALTIHTVDPVRKLESFMFSTKPTWAKVRWVHMAGISDLNDLHIRRLAIKYQLHPLAVEDCLKKSDIIRCKYEHYEDHSFLVVPVTRPVDEAKSRLIQNYIQQHRIQLFERDQALADGNEDGADDYTDLKPAALHDMLKNLHCLMRKPQQLCIFMARDNNVLSVQEDPDVDRNGDVSSCFQLWGAMYNDNMGKPYSKLRNHDAYFLVAAILNAIVDDMRPLIQVFEVKVAVLEALQVLEGTKFDTKLVSHAKKQLVALDKLIRPFLDLIEGPLSDQDHFQSGEVKNYVRDVKDHLKQMASNVKEYQAALLAIVADDQYTRAKAQADVSYTISVVAALFLPGTFMTGLYGMNFDNMPELHTQNGYYVWWVVFLSICTGMVSYLKYYRGWI
ncbi:CorA Metal Ion Transporter (MIT) Family [Achlya hypogyna]|uniref:CorA Metal Ion Transporter (MIT) Family n=1 Tax=Achlya hypogyna TaxID=1202772 RepID=A0A1V9YLP9_ACHHY|nr:CorA Metal Ion Transporter (MIT) Family [Achlya hypogyna]